MKRKIHLKATLLLFTGSIFLQNCGSDRYEPCDVHWTLNQDYIDNLLFDYEHTDTLLYKRTINDVVTDTLVFVKQEDYRDLLNFSNQSAMGDPSCSTQEFTRERIGWDYSSQYDSIFFNVQVVASGEGKGFDEVLTRLIDTVLIVDNFFFIGNFGVEYEQNYATTEGLYDYCWESHSYNKREYRSQGTVVQDGKYKTGWQSYYNIDHGIVEISKTDRTEVWELIP